MSKSKGNVVNPDEYIAKYGADALRLYLMFMGPVELGGDFRDSGMAGMRRWVEKIWRILSASLEKPVPSADRELDRALGSTVAKVTEDLEARRYNTAISAMMEFMNLVGEKKRLSREQIETFLIILSPLAPYLTEELWANFGHSNSVHAQKWPEVSAQAVENVVIAVSVNGKTRSTLVFSSREAKLLEQEKVELAAKNDKKVAKYLAGKTIKRVIYVPGKIINLVI